MKIYSLFLSVWLALLIGPAFSAETLRQPKLTEIFGSSESIDLVTKATLVRASRIERNIKLTQEALDAKLHSEKKLTPDEVYARMIDAAFLPVGKSPNLTSEQSKQLRELLLSSSTYTPIFGKSLGKGCDFLPIIKVIFEFDSKSVAVFFCFACSEILVIRDGSVAGGWEFKPSRKPFLDLMKELFPSDDLIGKLR